MGMKDHIRNTSVHFHPIGIGGKTMENFNPRQDIYVQEEQSWNIMTLGTIMAALGHKGVCTVEQINILIRVRQDIYMYRKNSRGIS